MSDDRPQGIAGKAAEVMHKAAEKAERVLEPPVPGAPGPEAPSAQEPTEPREPLPPRSDQQAPENRTVSGADLGGPATARGQQGRFLTTADGVRLRDTDHSLKAGERGPTLLQDHHLREKVSHFDHERIPERVVHARGAAAHGVFVGNGSASNVCRSAFLRDGAETPVFVRFSTVLGSRGSADTARDTRGFATKFYTDEGTFDLVGNNIPVFFIQDGIKFPDVVHAAKPHPDKEIPQAQSAHDTFWDFASLHTEAQHHTIWNMSDRGIPRSFRTMEGFGVHTFRLIAEDGATSLVKFHWKPRLGVHSITWEEAQTLNGIDPDFHRRDLADAIESGAYPQWDLGLQVMPDTPEQTFEGIDLLDPTKLVPEELAPVQHVGTLTLNANPTNYFAETEQVAFHTAHLVPGIDITDDPLLAARNFSYLDTQITRLGGPNFNQIPINRPHAPVNDMLRDGMHQQGVHPGAAPYKPNSLDGGCPFHAGMTDGAFVEVAQEVAGRKDRAQPASYDDHFSQVRMFWQSMTPVEKEHIVLAYTFELGKCYEQTVKERQLACLAQIDPVLCAEVATGLGLEPPAGQPPEPVLESSPALSQVGGTWPADGRQVGILVDPESLPADLETLRSELFNANVVPLVIAPHGGKLGDGTVVQRTLLTTRAAELDALILAGAPGHAPDADPPRDSKAVVTRATTIDPRILLLVQEAYRHCKPIAAVAEGLGALTEAGLEGTETGVLTGGSVDQLLSPFLGVLAQHRVWNRFATSM